jgi:hypothetical protein
VIYSLNFIYNTKILCKINQAAKQASKPNDFGQASQASKLEVSKIASQQAEGPRLGLLACYQLRLYVTSKMQLNSNKAADVTSCGDLQFHRGSAVLKCKCGRSLLCINSAASSLAHLGFSDNFGI